MPAITEKQAELYNTQWTEAELVLVYKIWKQHGGQKTVGATTPWVAVLAEKMGRTVASISMRVGNFAAYDLDLPQNGLCPGGRRMQGVVTTIKTLEALGLL